MDNITKIDEKVKKFEIQNKFYVDHFAKNKTLNPKVKEL